LRKDVEVASSLRQEEAEVEEATYISYYEIHADSYIIIRNAKATGIQFLMRKI
jgi:hypothetical protein